jgi:hypothetical protein
VPYTVCAHPSEKGKFALKHKDGSLHKSSKGHVYIYESKEDAVGAAHYIAVSEHMKKRGKG